MQLPGQRNIRCVLNTILILLLFHIPAGKSESSQSHLSRVRSKFVGNSFWANNYKKYFSRRNKKLLKTTTYRVKESNTGTNNSNENTNRTETTETAETMGQAMRMYQYDRAENERNAIPVLTIGRDDDSKVSLEWHRLDDGVMGGKSKTLHVSKNDGSLHFAGTINTDGGGFCSIRSPIPDSLPKGITAIRLKFRGDGKTYKLTLSDGEKSKSGPSKRGSWQYDIPTKKPTAPAGKEAEKKNDHDDNYETITIPFSALQSSFGPWAKTEAQKAIKFDVNSMRQIGFMLSTKLSDGSNNPVETFGSGIFPFSLELLSIEPIVGREEGVLK